jgi:hypothetical protein
VGFIVTNLETSSRVVVRFYNKRGTAEQWIKEGKQAAAMTVTTVIRKLRFDRAFEMTPSAATEPRSVARAPDASRCYTELRWPRRSKNRRHANRPASSSRCNAWL